MKWIKASERLPEKDGFYIADSDWIGDAINEIVPNDRSDTNFLNGKFECGKNWRVTAWLDEASTSDNTQSIDKELAGKIWDAACKFNHEEFMYLERGIHIQAPDKETFINSLNLDNTQIRDVEDMALNYAANFGKSKPEQFTDEQVGRLHGFIDGYNAAILPTPPND